MSCSLDDPNDLLLGPAQIELSGPLKQPVKRAFPEMENPADDRQLNSKQRKFLKFQKHNRFDRKSCEYLLYST